MTHQSQLRPLAPQVSRPRGRSGWRSPGTWLAALATAGATFGIWAALNRPVDNMPAYRGEIGGFAFSPFHAGESPQSNVYPTIRQIDSDLALVATKTHNIRTYTVQNDLGDIPALAAKYRDEGVCGFDIAGPEDGFRPTAHLRAFHLIQREDFHLTIHAGEAFGLPSIWEAVQFCNAERLGHGVRIVDDIVALDGAYVLGRLANYIRDRRIPLEVCPTSNVHTGAAASIAAHPINLLKQLRFRVTLNTDNRLMSGITLSSEFASCAEVFAWTLDDMEWLTLNAAKSAFFEFDQRLALINNVIKPGYAALRAEP